MPMGILYWLFYVLYIVLGFWVHGLAWPTTALTLILLVLLFLLGWKVFGFIVR